MFVAQDSGGYELHTYAIMKVNCEVPFFATSFIVCLTVTDRDEKILLRPEVGWMDIKLKVTKTKISDVTFCAPSVY